MAATQASPILVFGDSLSAGYGPAPRRRLGAAKLQKRLQAQGYVTPVVNASVSGETSGGGVQRLPRALQLHNPSLVILELGANDGLRGLPIPETRANLEKNDRDSVRSRRAHFAHRHANAAPNYGPALTRPIFYHMYTDIAQRDHVPFVPFLLESVALNPAYMQADGMHPNARGAPLILDTIWPQLLPLLHKH